jgi:hypothetical protein
VEDQELLDIYGGFEAMIALYNPTYTFAIANLHNLFYVRDTIGIGVHEGDPVRKGSVTYETIYSGQPLKHVVTAGQNAYGDHEYMAISIPVYQEGTIYGAVTWCVTTDGFKLAQTATELLSLSEQLMATANSFAGNSTQLAESNEELAKHMDELKSEMGEIKNVNKFVNKIATESKILGINAAIESARLGELGAGFGVVANEIRRLATDSKTSAKEISEQIEATDLAFLNMAKSIQFVAGSSEEQAASAEELLAAIEHIRDLATSLSELASKSLGQEEVAEPVMV